MHEHWPERSLTTAVLSLVTLLILACFGSATADTRAGSWVSYGAPVDPIDGPSQVCPASTNGHCGPAGMAVYAWSVSGSGTIVGSDHAQCVQIQAGNPKLGDYTLTLNFTDMAGAPGTAQKTVAVVDTIPPVISCPPNRRAQCGGNLEYGEATATDNCDPNPAITWCDKKVPGNCPGDYLMVRTWFAVDDAGNLAARGQKIIVTDRTPPEITCPPDRSFEIGQTIDFGWPTVHDACDEHVAVTYEDRTIAGDCAQAYTIVRKWTAADDCGNNASCEQRVAVEDRTAPVLSAVRDTSALCNGEVVFTQPGATDNCDPNPAVEIVSTTIVPGPEACQYTHTRCWVARDASGNASNQVCQSIVRNVDAAAPVVVCGPDKAVLPGDPILFDQPQVTDNCPLGATLQASLPIMSGGAEGETTYTRCWVAYDLCGNISNECCQTITVQAAPNDGPCSFVCYDWTAACLEDPNREISTTPACIRDDHFLDVFPSGATVGSHSAPRRYMARWTSARAVETFKCGYGLPAAMTRDYTDPGRWELGSIYGEILALRLNREFSCGGYLAEIGHPALTACYGNVVIPPEVERFAGLTVDQFLAVADQALSGNTAALVPYGNSMLRLQAAAQYMNWYFSSCGGQPLPQPPLFVGGDDGDGGGEPVAVPERFEMKSQPNPMRAGVTISLALPTAGQVSLELYDVRGRKVVTVARERMAAGYRTVTWNGTDELGARVGSGVYFLRVEIDGRLTAMEKLMKL